MKSLLKLTRNTLIITFVVVVLCESILYLIGWGDPVVYIRDDKCHFRIAPNQKRYMLGPQININSLGMRGPEPDSNKNNIVFLGDSVTYGGAQIQDDKIFVGILNKRLSGIGYQALNAGVNNYGPKNIEQLFYILKSRIDFHYTILVIPSIDFTRDFEYNTSQFDLFHSFPLRTQFFGTLFLYRAKTILLNFINDYRYDFAYVNDNQKEKEDYILLQENAMAYKNIIKRSEHILVFFIPSRNEAFNRKEDKIKQFYLNQLSEVAKSSQIFNLYPALIEYGPGIFRDHCHLNEKGHKIISNIFWQTIKDKWLSKIDIKEK